MGILLISITNIFTTKERLIFFTIISFLLLSLGIFSERFKSRMINSTIGDLNKNNTIYFFSSGHEKHFNLALEIFKKNKIFGIGPNNFRKECEKDQYKSDKYICTTHPHNFYLQILSETGIVGFLFVIFFFYKIIIFGLSNFLKRNNLSICIAIALFINFFPIAPTGNFFSSWLLNLNILPLLFFQVTKK